MELTTLILRFLIVSILSLLYGLERQRAHKSISFGTFILVSVGACGLSIASLNFGGNSLSLLAAIVTGIGFLGAGALIKTTDKVFGFTTAASIWIFAIFGLLIGIGQYLEGGVMYSLIWFVVIIDNYFEHKGIGSYKKKFTILTNKVINLTTISNLLPEEKFKLISVELNKKDNKLIVSYYIEGSKEEINKIPNKIYNEPWFESCKIE